MAIMRMFFALIAVLAVVACGGSSVPHLSSVPATGPAGEMCAAESGSRPSNDRFVLGAKCRDSRTGGEIAVDCAMPNCAGDAAGRECAADRAHCSAIYEQHAAECWICATGWIPAGNTDYCEADCWSSTASCLSGGGTCSAPDACISACVKANQ